jgi:hypothetical protein
MKSLIVIILVLIITALVYVYNLPPKLPTIKDLHPTTNPKIRAEEPPANSAYPVDSIKTHIGDEVPETHTGDEVPVYYYIIVGSAPSQVLAQQKADKLKKDFRTDFIVLPPTREGNYRISNGEYASLEQAKSAIINIRRTVRSDAWIFSVKK